MVFLLICLDVLSYCIDAAANLPLKLYINLIIT